MPGLFLLGLVVGLTTASTVVGQTPADSVTTVSYDVTGYVNAGGGGVLGPWGGRDVKVLFGNYLNPVTLEEAFEADASNAIHGEARAEVSVFAQADEGLLRVGLTSGVLRAKTKAATGPPGDLHSASASMNTGTLQARWQDTVIPDAAGIYKKTIFLGLLEISGNLDLSFDAPVIPPGTYSTNVGSGGDLMVRLFSSADLVKPYPQGYVGRIKGDTISGTYINDPPTTLIPVQMIMRDGEPFTIDYMLELICGAGAGLGTEARVDVSTAVYFDANFTHTLRWGGIISATDFDTGLPVTDYSLISASGFDYRLPAPVPEPAVGATLVCLISLCLATRRRRCQWPVVSC